MENQRNRSDVVEIDLRELFHLLISKLAIIIVSGIFVGLAAILGTMLLVTPTYESTTKMYVLNKQSTDTVTSAELQASTYLTKDYAELIKSRTVTESVIADLGLNMEHGELLGSISVSIPSDTRIISITVTSTDPYEAAEIANAVREAAAAHIKRVMDIEAVNVVEVANIPSQKAGPNTTRNGMMGAILGTFLAIALIVVTYLTNENIQTPEDVEKYLQLSVLGSIPDTGTTRSGKRKKAKRRKKA